jgi:hypothetical protein
MSDDYVTVTGYLRVATPKAILLQPEDEPAAIWIPRSLLHGGDERLIDNTAMGEQIDIRVREWFAEKEDLV